MKVPTQPEILQNRISIITEEFHLVIVDNLLNSV